MQENEIKKFDEKVKKASKRKEMSFRFCPSCASTNLKPLIFGFGKDSAAISPQMKCMNCGFYGFVFEGTIDFIKEFKESLKERKQNEK
jgi:hypothetical protein